MSSISRLICNVILPRTNNANCVRAIRRDCGGPRLLILEARNYVSDANELIKSVNQIDQKNTTFLSFIFNLQLKEKKFQRIFLFSQQKYKYIRFFFPCIIRNTAFRSGSYQHFCVESMEEPNVTGGCSVNNG